MFTSAIASVTGRSPLKTLKTIRQRRRAISSRSDCLNSQRGVGRGRHLRLLEPSSLLDAWVFRGRVIAFLLWQIDGLGLLVAQLHAQAALGGGNRQLAVAEPADQIEWLARRLLVGEPRGVVGNALLDRRAHLGCRLEEAVGGHEPSERLVGALEIVGVDEESEPARAVREVGKHRARQEFVPQGLPEALDLAERLRVLRPTLDVANAVAPQLALEIRLSPPGGVLPPLVGENLFRSSVGGDAARKRLHHQRRALMVGERVGYDEARVVVHERRQVETLMASQQKREDVRLPELVGSGSLEAPRRTLSRLRRLARLDEARLVEDPANVRLADAEPLETGEQVANAARPVLGVLLPQRHDCVVLHLLRRRLRPPARGRHLLGDEGVNTSLLVALHPILDGRHGGAEEPCQPAQARLSPQRLLHHPKPNR
jgi:hypothetical protein